MPCRRSQCALGSPFLVGERLQGSQPLLKALLERSGREQSQNASKGVLARDPAGQRQVFSQPRCVQFRPLGDRRGTIGVRDNRADGHHDHIPQSMKPIDVRPRVGKIIEEPQQVDRILSTHHQHRESFHVRICHTKRFSPKNPYRASPIYLKCALALVLDPTSQSPDTFRENVSDPDWHQISHDPTVLPRQAPPGENGPNRAHY